MVPFGHFAAILASFSTFLLMTACERREIEMRYFPAPTPVPTPTPVPVSIAPAPTEDRRKTLHVRFLHVAYDFEEPQYGKLYMFLRLADLEPVDDILPDYATVVPLISNHGFNYESPVHLPREMHLYHYNLSLPARKLDSIASRQMDVRWSEGEPLYLLWEARTLFGTNVGRGVFNIIDYMNRPFTEDEQLMEVAQHASASPNLQNALEHLYRLARDNELQTLMIDVNVRRRRFRYWGAKLVME